MARHKTFNLILIALTLTLTCSQEAGATKINAKPLPRNGDPAGQANYDRDAKDFLNDAQYNAPVSSRFKRRPDYRDIEKQQKEDDERKAKDAIEAKKAATEAQTVQEKKRLDAHNRSKVEAIEVNNQAVALGSQGKWVEAIAQHEKAIHLDPSHKQYRTNLSAARAAYGDKKLKDGDFSGAASLFRKALYSAPDNAHAAKGLSQALEKCGVDPVDTDARIALGDQLVNANDLEGAYIEFKQAMEVDASAKVLVKLGDLQYRWGQVHHALSCYQQAAIKDPNYGPAQRQLGIIKLLQKDETGAAALLRKAVILDSDDVLAGQTLVDIWRRQVSKNPLNPDFHLGFAGALQLTGDFAGAESEYKKLEMLANSHPGLAEGRASLQKAYLHGRSEKHRKAAETLFSQGLKKEALAEISQAVMAEPRNSRYQFLLGECLEAHGDYKGAHQAYLTCVLIDPEKNKEAAARMKEMQQSGGIQSTAPSAVAQPQQMYRQQPAGFNPTMPQQMMSQPGMAMPPQSMQRNPGYMPQQGGMMTGNGYAQPGMMPMQQPGGMQMMQAGSAQLRPQGYTMPPQGFNRNMYEGAPQAAMRQPAGFPPQQAQQQPPQTYMAQNNQPVNATRNFPNVNADSTIYPQGAPQHNVTVPTNSQMDGATGQQANQDPKLVKVVEAESQKDYMTAVAALREILATDLENSTIHHRLAVNLMAAGRISEAVTEFRISSALKPADKTYADDLARALSIHKRSIMSNNDGRTAGDDANKGGGNE